MLNKQSKKQEINIKNKRCDYHDDLGERLHGEGRQSKGNSSKLIKVKLVKIRVKLTAVTGLTETASDI